MARRSAPTPPPTPPPPAEVSAAELARLAGYSKMQVSKWGPMGLSKLGRVVLQGTQKRILYRRDDALVWIKGNATGVPGAHGGKRPGGGRKKGAKGGRGIGHRASGIGPKPVPSAPAAAGPVPTGSAPDPSTPLAATPAPRRLTPPRHVEPVAPPPSTPGHLGTSTPAPAAPLTREQLRELTPIEVKQHLDIEKILSERIARGEKERTLISVEAARKEWSDACTAAARVLGKLRDTLAARLITDLGLASSKAPRLRQVIDQETVHVLRAMRTASFGPEDDDALG